jgi:hypothetical protein
MFDFLRNLNQDRQIFDAGALAGSAKSDAAEALRAIAGLRQRADSLEGALKRKVS